MADTDNSKKIKIIAAVVLLVAAVGVYWWMTREPAPVVDNTPQPTGRDAEPMPLNNRDAPTGGRARNPQDAASNPGGM